MSPLDTFRLPSSKPRDQLTLDLLNWPFNGCSYHSGKFQQHRSYKNRYKQGGHDGLSGPGHKHQKICPGKIGLTYALVSCLFCVFVSVRKFFRSKFPKSIQKFLSEVVFTKIFRPKAFNFNVPSKALTLEYRIICPPPA